MLFSLFERMQLGKKSKTFLESLGIFSWDEFSLEIFPFSLQLESLQNQPQHWMLEISIFSHLRKIFSRFSRRARIKDIFQVNIPTTNPGGKFCVCHNSSRVLSSHPKHRNGNLFRKKEGKICMLNWVWIYLSSNTDRISASSRADYFFRSEIFLMPLWIERKNSDKISNRGKRCQEMCDRRKNRANPFRIDWAEWWQRRKFSEEFSLFS